MGTFGEVVEPSSRSAWEDWDEATGNSDYSTLKWQDPLDIPGEIESFFVLESKYLSDCLEKQSEVLLKINTVKEVNLDLFKTHNANQYICVLKDYDLIMSSDIVGLIQDLVIKSKMVVTVQIKPIPDYQTAQSILQPCIIRKVNTTHSIDTLDLNYAKLEQPNIISGVSAGVITLREHLKSSGTAFICYIEHSEEYRVEELQKLLLKLNIIQTCSVRQNSVLNSNLYI